MEPTQRNAPEPFEGLLAGDAILLAGATGRVGGATLRTLLAWGAANVLLVSRSVAGASAAIAEHVPPDRLDRVSAFEADLREPDAGVAAVEAARGRFGRVDAAVCLAGGGTRFVRLVDSTPGDLAESVANNLTLARNFFLPALRAMLAAAPRPGARSRGRLVAVTAGSSLDPQPRFGLMGMGKAGVNLLMLAIAREHKADGIVANAVVLGTVATESARAYLEDADFDAAASPGEVADVLAFHASDASTGVNGALIHLNARETD